MSNIVNMKFIPLYKFIVNNSIYIPKIHDQRNELYYVNYIESQSVNFDLNYINFIKGYNTKIELLNLDCKWIYYYVYIILLCDYGNLINRKLYNSIVEKVLESDYVKKYKIDAIKQIMISCGKTPDIIDGWMEGDILSLLDMMIELNLEEDFSKIINDIRYTTIESFRSIIPYFIELMENDKDDKKYSKYYDILRGKTTKKINLGKYILHYTCYYYPNQIILLMEFDNCEYSCTIVEQADDVHYLEELTKYFNFLSKFELDETKFKITIPEADDEIYLEAFANYASKYKLNKTEFDFENSFGLKKFIKINLEDDNFFDLELVEKKNLTIDKTFTFEYFDSDDLDNILTIRFKKYCYDDWIIYAFDLNDQHWRAIKSRGHYYSKFENILELAESNNLGFEYDYYGLEDKDLILFDKSNNLKIKHDDHSPKNKDLSNNIKIILRETNIYREPILF